MSPANIIRRFSAVMICLCAVVVCASAQAPAPDATPQPTGNGISLAPARVELEMQPGSETTMVVNLDYHSSENSQPVRIVASLNDWTIDREGQVQFEKANTLPNSASPWLIYSPAETTVIPGNLHAIRVTITVPKDATPGDHLTALIIEQRPDNIKLLTDNRRQMVIRYRMGAVFYIKVPQLRRQGSLESLRAEATDDKVVVTPLLKNAGNSVIRPLTSLKVTDKAGIAVAELPQKESLPLLGGAELVQPLVLESRLAPGTYTVKYRVDFQDGSRPTEGVTELVIPQK